MRTFVNLAMLSAAIAVVVLAVIVLLEPHLRWQEEFLAVCCIILAVKSAWDRIEQ